MKGSPIIRRRRRLATNAGPSFSMSITGLTANPTHGDTAQIGVQLTAVASGWSDGAPASVAFTWNGIAGTPSGTGNANYTPVAGDDLNSISVTATPADTYDAKNSATYTVRYAAPAEDAAPSTSGSATTGQSLTGVAGTFTGSDLTTGNEWEVSDDGSTGWTGTGDTDTTSPVQVTGKYYRFATTSSNSGGSLTTYSGVTGPATVAPAVTAPAFTEVPGVSSGTVLTYTAPDGADLTRTVVLSPTTTGAEVSDPVDLDSGPAEISVGSIEGSSGPGAVLTFYPPIADTKDTVDNIEIAAQFYHNSVAQGSVVTFLGSSELGAESLTFARPSDTDQIDVRGTITDSNGSVSFTTVVAEATVIASTPPVAEDQATWMLAGASATTINLIGSSSGSIIDATSTLGTISNITSTGCDYTPPATVTGDYEEAVLDFTIETADLQTDDGEVRIYVHDAAATVGADATIEAEDFNFDGWVQVIDDVSVSGSQYIQGNSNILGTPGKMYATFNGATGDYDLTVHYRTDTSGTDNIKLYVDDALAWEYAGDGGANEWTTAVISAETITNGDELRFEVVADSANTAWAKVDKLVIATAAAASYPDYGELVTGQSAVSVDTDTVSLPSSPTTGNIIFLASFEQGVTGSGTFGDYTQIADVEETTDSEDLRMFVGYKISDGTETGGQKIEASGDSQESHLIAELDASGGGTLDVVQTVTDDGRGSVTLAVDTGDTDRAIVIVAVGYLYQTAITGFSSTAGWTEVENGISGSVNDPAPLLFMKELPSGGTDSFTFTATAGANTTRGTVGAAWVIRGI